MAKNFRGISFRIAISALTVSFALSSYSGEFDDSTVAFNIPGQELSAALIEFSRQSKITVIAPTILTDGLGGAPVRGELSPDRALEMLLAKSSLKVRRRKDGAFIILPREGKALEKKLNIESLALADSGSDQGKTTEPTDNQIEEGDIFELEEIVVTGTNIRGVKDQFSPVIQLSRDDIDITGQSTIGEVFSSLVQNFNGGISLSNTGALASAGAGNIGVNLRGLGNEATLVLLNGRRLAPGGNNASFVDISAIPTSAIDRIEVVTDGASAIYGSDAIAGVVNIILRNDFEGAETRLSLDTFTDGGATTYRLGQTLGFLDDYANGLVTYEYASEDELDAKDREFSQGLQDPTTLLPSSEKHSAFASGGIVVNDRAKITADAYYENRKSHAFSSSQTIALSQVSQQSNVTRYGGTIGAEYLFSGDWVVNLAGTYSESDFHTDIVTFSTGVDASNLFSSDTSILSFDTSIGGPLFRISTEPVQAVVGGHYRKESVDLFDFNRQFSLTQLDVEDSRDVVALYGEMVMPIVTETNNLSGVNRLSATIAARYEDYSDVGSSFAPKVGLVWSPFAGLSLRGSYSSAFRAPRLDQLIDDPAAVTLNRIVDPGSPTGDSVLLSVIADGNADLKPEEADTFSIGFDFSPDSLPQLKVRGTYFKIEYDGRVARPDVVFDPAFRVINFNAPLISDPDQATVQSIISNAESFFNFSDVFPFIPPLSPVDTKFIALIRPLNISTSEIDGYDIETSYFISTGASDLNLTLNITFLSSFENQFSPVAISQDLVDTFGNPPDFRLRGGISWSKSIFTASFFVNHTGSYQDDEASTGIFDVGSFTTIDATLRLNLEEKFSNFFTADMTLLLNVKNLLNEDPPQIGPRAIGTPIFDPANANPTGRRIGLLITKTF